MTSRQLESREPFRPDEQWLAARVRSWTDLPIIPIDAGEIARAAALASTGRTARGTTLAGATAGWPLRLALIGALLVSVAIAAAAVVGALRSSPSYSGVFTPARPMALARSYPLTARLADGRVLVLGGQAYGLPLSGEVYDPSTDSFSRIDPDIQQSHPFEPVFVETITALPDGRVLVMIGGVDADGHAITPRLLDPDTGRTQPTGPMTTTRDGHAATLLADGKVLITGGSSDASAEIYDPATGQFTPTGPMSVVRADYTATLLRDGRVLILGGRAWNPADHLTSAELYDPTSGTFAPTGSMALARLAYAVTTLPDGRVLVAGGYVGRRAWHGLGAQALASAELYDPVTGNFAPTGSMSLARSDLGATILADGRVLVVGGGTDFKPLGNGVELLGTVSAEIYDTETGTFLPSGSTSVPRVGSAVALLRDGRVLVAGGSCLGPDPWCLDPGEEMGTNTVELFH